MPLPSALYSTTSPRIQTESQSGSGCRCSARKVWKNVQFTPDCRIATTPTSSSCDLACRGICLDRYSPDDLFLHGFECLSGIVNAAAKDALNGVKMGDGVRGITFK